MSGELPPIRCVTCNKVLADKWNKYVEMIEDGNTIENTLNALGLTRPCCRLRMRNPFKYVERIEMEGDETLYTAEKPNSVATSAALNSMKIPEHEDIELPPIPILPAASEQKKITRTYQAW